MHSARVSIGKTSLAVRYAALAPAEAKKKMIAPHQGERDRGEVAEEEARRRRAARRRRCRCR